MSVQIPVQFQRDDLLFVLIPRGQKGLQVPGWNLVENGRRYDDPVLLEHLEGGGNYGTYPAPGSRVLLLDIDDADGMSVFIDDHAPRRKDFGAHLLFLAFIGFFQVEHVVSLEVDETLLRTCRAADYDGIFAGAAGESIPMSDVTARFEHLRRELVRFERFAVDHLAGVITARELRDKAGLGAFVDRKRFGAVRDGAEVAFIPPVSGG